jgi:hypothetical protein
MNKSTWDSIPSDALLMNVIDSSIDYKYSWHRQYVLRDKVFHDKTLAEWIAGLVEVGFE